MIGCVDCVDSERAMCLVGHLHTASHLFFQRRLVNRDQLIECQRTPASDFSGLPSQMITHGCFGDIVPPSQHLQKGRRKTQREQKTKWRSAIDNEAHRYSIVMHTEDAVICMGHGRARQVQRPGCRGRKKKILSLPASRIVG